MSLSATRRDRNSSTVRLVSLGKMVEIDERKGVHVRRGTKVCLTEKRELKHRRFIATDVSRKFTFLLLTRFHARPLSYKALILDFTT